MSNILVTGGAGFIGSHVSRLLIDQNHEVTILDNLKNSSKKNIPKKARLIVGDIADSKITKEALYKQDAVIHMAGLIIVPESVKNPIKYCDNNVLGTINLLESMRHQKIKKIVFSSSACVYGTPKTLPIKEDAPVIPDNPYGATKASIENFLQSYFAVFDFDTIILRYFNPYGPGEHHHPETHAIPNFIKSALVKKPIPLYWNGEQIRDFVYIEDLAQAHIAVLPLSGYQVFNIGTEKGVKVKDVLAQIFEILGYTVPINNLGRREGDVQASFASSKVLEATVGWKAKVALQEGLKKTVEYYKKADFIS